MNDEHKGYVFTHFSPADNTGRDSRAALIMKKARMMAAQSGMEVDESGLYVHDRKHNRYTRIIPKTPVEGEIVCIRLHANHAGDSMNHDFQDVEKYVSVHPIIMASGSELDALFREIDSRKSSFFTRLLNKKDKDATKEDQEWQLFDEAICEQLGSSLKNAQSKLTFRSQSK